ncbi:MAG: 50S ribosomal protein L6 [Chloroflexi bacterium]|nr:50S ribosomal protein L6 [Chloroflexota bacterium]
MSRIGRAPIPVPTGVQIQVEDDRIRVTGPKGELARSIPGGITARLADGHIMVDRASDARAHRALHGLTRTLIANMVEGVTKGFQKNLEISGVGYRATKSGDRLVLSLGYSSPVELLPPPGISFMVESPTKLGVAGIDRELVGRIAAQIRAVRPPEPYKGKGMRYADERIRRKAGKGGKAGAKKK